MTTVFLLFCHQILLLFMSSKCPDYLDPRNLIVLNFPLYTPI
ncbi:hypothetical protein WANA31_0941 [Wolbachia endosymbiont of Drosophila ananassae]|nr:hypothetical protein WANA13_1286 [Wolbachia endosymbiont of Drosophila ananassae]RLT60655.1 hypothetical protein WANA31_0941 [Wolbachia endosymbiont of Drosophila ananassae]RLT62318.1 hypothetical protein WANA34_1021 [Wolbachia endosymbiont of Drosophila ananassae]